MIQLGQVNGGLRDLTRKAGVPYSTIWNQVNRQHGILAAFIPPIVSASGDPSLLAMLADECGYMVAPKPRFLRTRREIRRQGMGLAIAVGRALEVIDQALTDGLINSAESDKVHRTLNHVCATSIEIGETIKKGTFLRGLCR
jgi:hypothetical protein